MLSYGASTRALNKKVNVCSGNNHRSPCPQALQKYSVSQWFNQFSKSYPPIDITAVPNSITSTICSVFCFLAIYIKHINVKLLNNVSVLIDFRCKYACSQYTMCNYRYLVSYLILCKLCKWITLFFTAVDRPVGFCPLECTMLVFI